MDSKKELPVRATYSTLIDTAEIPRAMSDKLKLAQEIVSGTGSSNFIITHIDVSTSLHNPTFSNFEIKVIYETANT